MPGEERRAYRRFNVEFPVEYKLAAFQEHMTQTSSLDISANGLRLRVKDKPLMGEEIHLTIDLPIKKKVMLAARVIWSKVAENNSYDIGVQLADTKSEDGKIFMDFYSQQLLNFIDTSKDQGPVIV
jgi:Tfp pilus assembly protein PilZ